MFAVVVDIVVDVAGVVDIVVDIIVDIVVDIAVDIVVESVVDIVAVAVFCVMTKQNRCAKCARSLGNPTTSFSCSASSATERTTRTASPPPQTSLQRESGFAGSAWRAPPAASLRFGIAELR